MMQKNPYCKKILVVEDDAIAKLAVKTYLEKLGCYVEVANNGIEALELLEEHIFDLVLSDINMPKMNGLEFAKAIRMSERHFKKIFIIAITANTDNSIKNQAKEAGINHIFSKPININMLENLISQF